MGTSLTLFKQKENKEIHFCFLFFVCQQLEKETTTGHFNSTIDLKPDFSLNITCQAVNTVVYDTMGNTKKGIDSLTAKITVSE